MVRKRFMNAEAPPKGAAAEWREPQRGAGASMTVVRIRGCEACAEEGNGAEPAITIRIPIPIGMTMTMGADASAAVAVSASVDADVSASISISIDAGAYPQTRASWKMSADRERPAMTKQSTTASYADTGTIMVMIMMIAADVGLGADAIGRACSPMAERT